MAMNKRKPNASIKKNLLAERKASAKGRRQKLNLFLSDVEFQDEDRVGDEVNVNREATEILLDFFTKMKIKYNFLETASKKIQQYYDETTTEERLVISEEDRLIHMEHYLTVLYKSVKESFSEPEQTDGFDYTNRYKNAFYDAFVKHSEALINMAASSDIGPKEKFYNTVKAYAVMSLFKYAMTRKNLNAGNAIVVNCEIGYFRTFFHAANTIDNLKLAIRMVNGQVDGFEIKPVIDLALSTALFKDRVCKYADSFSYSTPYTPNKSFDQVDVLRIFTDTVNMTATAIAEHFYFEEVHRNKSDNPEPEKGEKEDVAEYVEKIKALEKSVEAYKKAFTSSGIKYPEETEQAEKENTNELEKQLADRNAALAEIEAQNKKLSRNLEEAARQNSALRAALKETAPENTEIPEAVILPEIDYKKKYAFIMQNRQPFEVEAKLKETFPNCMFISKTEQINPSIDLVIFMTSYLSHGLYKGIKKYCRDSGINYTHCSNMNHDQIVKSIKNYYYTRS